MGTASKKLNFFVDDDVRKDMENLIPTGQRAKVINEALRKELLRIKRTKVTEKLMNLRTKGEPVSSQEIIEALRKDRRRP
jgi:hypothetical protein